MPACATDNLSRFAHMNGHANGGPSPKSNGSPRVAPRRGSPPSPTAVSPNARSSLSALRRSASSTFSLIPEEGSPPRERAGARRDSGGPASGSAWGQMFVVLPTLWVAAWLWIFWKTIRCPLDVVGRCVSSLRASASDGDRRRRTVMISGGSTIQALHLARNFHCSGARVVVVEIEGHFGLAKFSTAVAKFRAIAKPRADDPQAYADALCEIAKSEGANFYVPVCATSSAYFDAIAKPRLEAAGCSCFVPGLREVAVLDDVAEVMRRCREMEEPTPPCAELASREDVDAWYETAREGKHFMASSGLAGIRERVKFIMPRERRDFRLEREISRERPWVVVEDAPGDHYLTCTTVRESRVVANVSCKIDPKSRGLAHEFDPEIEAWLRKFFAELRVDEPITGHVSFRFARDARTGTFLPLGAKVGVSLPYICHTSVHPRLLWKPCPHFDGRKSGPATRSVESYWMHEAVLKTLRHPGLEAVTQLIGTVLDKREALFAYWDPLPYCAYYHLQLPFASVLGYARRKRREPRPR